ncbi:branched-subunit amino acid transport protein [Hallerella porci]|uniref:Branched-subunit amino acid transport protein n=2 Tax=Hallerella porci TaxID=1945871 RepID=A0ABX5LQ76_9BACT|nr:branched-subunit amino acid transport protein [Hallerella porci]
MNLHAFCIYLFTMTGVTYLLRALPFILLKKELKSEFWNSFLAYIPYTVLAAMTVPAIFYATEHRLSGIAAFIAAVTASLLGRGLVIVACAATAAVLFVDGIIL